MSNRPPQGEEEAMRYFTPELYVRGQSEDASVLDEVERAWEDNLQRYAAHLRGIRPELPAGLVELLDRFDLHDADLLGLGRREMTLIAVVQPDPAIATLLLTYTLTGEPFLDRDALPAQLRSRQAQWLYDEVDLVRGEAPQFEQSILLSNGWEVRVRFSDFHLTVLEPLLLSESARRRLEEARRIEGLHAAALRPEGTATS
jgi:hypothetical protein